MSYSHMCDYYPYSLATLVSFPFKPPVLAKDMTHGNAGNNPTVKQRSACKGLLRHYRPTWSRIDIFACRSILRDFAEKGKVSQIFDSGQQGHVLWCSGGYRSVMETSFEIFAEGDVRGNGT
jgi:hypothetical protein